MRRANKKLIGAFVLGAAALLAIAIAVFGSGMIFKDSDKYVLFFERSVKGLSTGAPVLFKGVKIGNVTDLRLVEDPDSGDVLIEVIIDVTLANVQGLREGLGYPDYKKFIARGLRAKLDLQSFVTGQLIISFGFYPDQPDKLYNLSSQYPQLPTLPTPPGIFAVMDELPISEISRNLEQVVSGLSKVINSQGVAELDRTLREMTEAARATRLLMEYLEQHPEAFLKGKQDFKRGQK